MDIMRQFACLVLNPIMVYSDGILFNCTIFELLMEQFDTMPIQCRHIEHMHEGVWIR